MKRIVLAFLAAVLAVSPAAAQSSAANTYSYGLFSRGSYVGQIAGRRVARSEFVRAGPDSAPASTANADSILFGGVALQGFTLKFDAFGTSATSNAKSVVITLTAAGSTVKLDSLQMKTGGGNWHSTCFIVIRNANPTTDSTQTAFCFHTGSGDSSTTASATSLVSTVKMIPSGQAKYAIHNSTGTAKGDVVVTGVVVASFPGGVVNP